MGCTCNIVTVRVICNPNVCRNLKSLRIKLVTVSFSVLFFSAMFAIAKNSLDRLACRILSLVFALFATNDNWLIPSTCLPSTRSSQDGSPCRRPLGWPGAKQSYTWWAARSKIHESIGIDPIRDIRTPFYITYTIISLFTPCRLRTIERERKRI